MSAHALMRYLPGRGGAPGALTSPCGPKAGGLGASSGQAVG